MNLANQLKGVILKRTPAAPATDYQAAPAGQENPYFAARRT